MSTGERPFTSRSAQAEAETEGGTEQGNQQIFNELALISYLDNQRLFSLEVIIGTPSHTTLPIRDSIYPNASPFTATSDKLKPYRGRLPVCSHDYLPILPADQVPPVAIEVTVPSPSVDLSIEDSASP
ncbi:hypothetical protein SprV_0200790100 [Sparganum proliferum]